MITYRNERGLIIIEGVKKDRIGQPAVGANVQLVKETSGALYGETTTQLGGYWSFSFLEDALPSGKYYAKFSGSRLIPKAPPIGDWELVDVVGPDMFDPIQPADVEGLLRTTITVLDSANVLFEYAVSINATRVTITNENNYAVSGVTIDYIDQHKDTLLDPENYDPAYRLTAWTRTPDTADIAAGETIVYDLTTSIISDAYKVKLHGTNLNASGLRFKITTRLAADEIDTGRLRVENDIRIQDHTGQGTILDKYGIRLLNNSSTNVLELRNTPTNTTVYGFGTVSALARIGKDGSDWGFVVGNTGTVYVGGWEIKKDSFADSGAKVLLSPYSLALGDNSSLYGAGLGIKNSAGAYATYVTGNEYWRYTGPESMTATTDTNLLNGTFTSGITSWAIVDSINPSYNDGTDGWVVTWSRYTNDGIYQTFTPVANRQYTISCKVKLGGTYTSTQPGNRTMVFTVTYDGTPQVITTQLADKPSSYSWHTVSINVYTTDTSGIQVKVESYWDTEVIEPNRSLYVDDVTAKYYSPYSELNANGLVVANSPTSYIQFGKGIAKVKTDTLDVNNISVYGDLTVFGTTTTSGTTVLADPIQALNVGATLPTYAGIEIDNTAGNNPMLVYTGGQWAVVSRTAGDVGSQSGSFTSADRIMLQSDVDKIYTETYVTVSNVANGTPIVIPNSKSYIMGSKKLLVFVNGILQLEGASNDYLEATTTTVTFNYDLYTGAKITFYILGW